MKLEQLMKLADKATPGPWRKGRTTHHTVSVDLRYMNYHIAEFHHAHDAELVDEMRNNIKRMCEVMLQMRHALIQLNSPTAQERVAAEKTYNDALAAFDEFNKE